MSPLLFAFGLTLLAGLSTGIGSAIACFTKRTDRKFLSVGLGFSAGVMIYIAFTEILAESNILLAEAYGVSMGAWVASFSFFAGMGIAALIDKLVPKYENPHEPHLVEEMSGTCVPAKDGRGHGMGMGKMNGKMCRHDDKRCLHRLGIMTAVALAIHNFPEGIATFASALTDPVLGVSIAIAVAIHNIPEGIAVAVPIYYATCDRKKAFWYSFLSGLAEPLGAVLGYVILSYFLDGLALGILFAGVAGIMVFISLDQLLPASREYGEHHHSVYGLVGGMAVMALSLLLLA